MHATIETSLPSKKAASVYLHSGRPSPWDEGCIVHFEPDHGPAWYGNCQNGLGAETKVIFWPEAKAIVVIAQGACYFVVPDEQKNWKCIDVFALNGILSPHRDVMVLSTNNDVVVLNKEGKELWRQRVAVEGVEIIRIADDLIYGRANYLTPNDAYPFMLSLTNGTSVKPSDPVKGYLAHSGLGIAVVALVAACLFGVLLNLILFLICAPYFTLSPTGSPSTQATIFTPLLSGLSASWWIGLLLGITWTLCARVGTAPKYVVHEFFKPIAVLLLIIVLGSGLAGGTAYLLVQAGSVSMQASYAGLIPPMHHASYMAVLWAHWAAYGCAALGGLGLAVLTILGRHQEALHQHTDSFSQDRPKRSQRLRWKPRQSRSTPKNS